MQQIETKIQPFYLSAADLARHLLEVRGGKLESHTRVISRLKPEKIKVDAFFFIEVNGEVEKHMLPIEVIRTPEKYLDNGK